MFFHTLLLYLLELKKKNYNMNLGKTSVFLLQILPKYSSTSGILYENKLHDKSILNTHLFKTSYCTEG